MSDSVILWTVAGKASLSIGFSDKNTSGLPYLPAGIEPTSLRSPALGSGFFTSSTPGKPEGRRYCFLKEEAEKATQVLTWLLEGESKQIQMLSNSRTAHIDKITPCVKKKTYDPELKTPHRAVVWGLLY